MTNSEDASETCAASIIHSGPEDLSSCRAVVVSGKNLLIINEGEKTVSMLSISKQNPSNKTLLAPPEFVPGFFSAAVAASLYSNIVFVGTISARSCVACAPYSPFLGIGKREFLRSFGLKSIKMPSGFADAVSRTCAPPKNVCVAF